MSLYPSQRARERIIDRYTPPASLDDPVRGTRVPDLYCRNCRTERGIFAGRECRCGGTYEKIPAEAWRWCRACNGIGIACNPGECGGLGVVIRSLP